MNQVQDHYKLSVVKILVDNIDFDWYKPYKTSSDYQSSGSGFFIDDMGTILTCFHVIEGSLKVWVTIPEMGKKRIEVDILSVCPQSDIALLRVKKYKNKKFIKMKNYNKSDKKNVLAVGYPLGSDNIKVSGGMISGIESYFLQVDAPINEGNSGGPLIQIIDSEPIAIGINSSKITEADNIGYAIPYGIFKSIETEMLNKGMEDNKIIYKPELLIWFSISSDFTFDFLNSSIKNGILITYILEESPLYKIGLRENDILVKFDGKEIDNFGECLIAQLDERIPLFDLLQYYNLNDEVIVEFWSNNQQKLVKEKIKLGVSNNFFKIKKKFPAFQDIDYEIYAGMVIMELDLNHIKLLKKSGFELSYMVELATFKQRYKRIKSILIITNIFPGSYLSSTNVIKNGALIKKINDKEITNLKEFRLAIKSPIKKNQELFFILETTNFKKIIIGLNKLNKEKEFIASKHNLSKITDSQKSDLSINKKKKYQIFY